MGLDQYAYKARRRNPNEDVSDDHLEIVDGSHAVITDGKWYGRKVNVIQHYMEKTTNIDNCECVYITEDMLDELENALSTIDDLVANNDAINSLIASHITAPDEGVTYIDGDEILSFTFTDEEAAVFGEFMVDNAPDELMPVGGFFYGPSDMDTEYYLHQLAEVRQFVNTIRPWLTDNTFAVYTCWY